MAWSNKTKISVSVLLPELIGAPVATLGAVYCMEKIPKQMHWLSQTVADNVVQPHLEHFEYFGKGLRRAHQDYDEKKREQQMALGKPVTHKGETLGTRDQRAFDIADGLVKTMLALGADFAATYGLQALLKKTMSVRSMEPFKTAATELSVHLGTMALMPTMFAKFSENVHYGIARTMEHKLGVNKEQADERARALTYVSLPGYGAALASLLYAHSKNAPRQR